MPRAAVKRLLQSAGAVGSVGNPRGLSKAGGQAGWIAGSLTSHGDGRGRDLPGLSTGRHFPQPFVVCGDGRADVTRGGGALLGEPGGPPSDGSGQGARRSETASGWSH